jgi:hypothetical protein
MDDRKKAEEARYALENDLRFKARTARNRRMALWAAELMGMNEEKAQGYVKEMIDLEISPKGDEAVFQRIHDDFRERKISKSDHQIRRAMDEFLNEELEKLGVSTG